MVDTLHPPPEVIASFPPPNFVDPQTQGPALLLLAVVLSALGVVIVGTRLYARHYITKALGIDDLLIVAATVFGIGFSVLVIIGNTKYYSGHHIWDIPLGTAVGHRINVWISQLSFMIALSCVKISVLLFYRRLSISFTRTFMIFTYVGIVYNAAFLCGFILALILDCRPLQAYWLSFDPVWVSTHRFRCGSEQIGQPLIGLFSVIGDFYSAMLPMILVSRLALPKRQKQALKALFGMAFLLVFVGIIRAVYLYLVVNVTYDFTWTLWKVWVLGVIELWFGVYIASAPALKPLFKRAFSEQPHSKNSLQGRRIMTFVVRGDSAGKLGKVSEFRVITPDISRGLSPYPDIEKNTKAPN